MTVKECILCGEQIDRPWGHKELKDHQESHSEKRFLGFVEIKL